MTSFGPAGNAEVRRVTRSWKSVTRAGFRITMNPQVDGAILCVSTAEIGRTVSKAT